MSSYEVFESSAEGAGGLGNIKNSVTAKVASHPQAAILIIGALVLAIIILIIYIVVPKTAPATAVKTSGFTTYADQHLGKRRGSSLSWQ